MLTEVMDVRSVTLAPDIVKEDELQEIQVFRERLEAEKEALRLLDAGNVTIWGAAEVEQARTLLATDLVNVDATLADQDSLLRALRVPTYSNQRVHARCACAP